MTRVAYVDEGGETVDLAPEDALRVLGCDPGLRREYEEWQAITGGRGGRLLVLDAERVRRALAQDAGAEGGLVKVWLDDLRQAPAGWVRVETPEEAIELLRGGEVAELSLDHDLGLDTEEAERSGYSVLLWLEQEVAEGRWGSPLPSVRIHSANPVGRARMERAIASIERQHAARARDLL